MFKSSEFKVGILVIAVSLLIVYMTIGVNEDPSYFGSSKPYWFYLEDATGLIKNSAVKLAGISIGVIKEIKLSNGKARLDIVVDPEVRVTGDTKIEIRAQGILGDRYVEILPGDISQPELEVGSQIVTVFNKGSFDAVMNEVSNLADNLNSVAETLKSSMTGDGDQGSPVGRIVSNLENLTADIAEITGEKKDEIKDIVENLHTVTAEIRQLVADDSEEGFKASFAKLNKGMARVDTITKNLEEVSDKLNSGKGTLGRLINDEQTVDELNTAIAGVSEFLGTASKTQTSIEFNSVYLSEPGLAKTYIGVRLQPGLDRYYELAVIDDPKGVVEETDTATSVNGNDPTSTNEKKTYKNKVKFTALFAKNFYDFTVKAGLIENSGGVGFEYHFLPKKLKLYFDAFEFDEDDPHLRAGIKYNLFHGIYLTGGADDFLSSGEVSGFVGAGLDLTNDDIKFLLSKVPF